MISEDQQEQGALHALGLLDADEADGFERLLAGDAALRDYVYDCREASVSLALAAESELGGPPTVLKSRITDAIARDGRFTIVPAGPVETADAPRGRIIRFMAAALPWASAALLMISCALLVIHQGRLRDENAALTASLEQEHNTPPLAAVEPLPSPLTRVAFCPLGPTNAKVPAQPLAVVAWDEDRQEGLVRIVQLTAPASGKDYQLWAVEAGHKDPVSAGLVHLDAEGRAMTVFKPVAVDGGSGRVEAFALSLEKAGGSPTNAGPILLLGKL